MIFLTYFVGVVCPLLLIKIGQKAAEARFSGDDKSYDRLATLAGIWTICWFIGTIVYVVELAKMIVS